MIVCSAVMMQNECLYRQYHDRRSWLFSKQPSLSAVNTTHHYNDTSYPPDPMYCEIELSELGTTGRWCGLCVYLWSCMSDTFFTEPEITMFPEDTEVTERRAVLFAVSGTGLPAPKMTWYHDGEGVVEDHSIEVTDDGYLMVPCAELRHSGVYQLVAVNKAGRAERQVTLTVREEEHTVPYMSNEGVTLSPIAVEQFADHVANCHFNSNKSFEDQFNVRVIEYESLLLYEVLSHCRR